MQLVAIQNPTSLKSYRTGYICPSGTQTPSWDVIYNNFDGYIECYIAKYWLYSTQRLTVTFCQVFDANIIGSDPLLDDHTILFGCIGNTWLCNQLC